MNFDPGKLTIFLTAAVALLLTPGPAVLYVVARSMSQGRRAGLMSVLGMNLGTLSMWPEQPWASRLC